MGVKNFKRLLISISKCIELNSELILVLGLGLGSHPGPRPNIYFSKNLKIRFFRIILFQNIEK